MIRRPTPRPAIPSADALARRLAGFAIISCDIFDTAVMRRLARPEDVLLAAGARAQARGLTTCSPAAFQQFRRAAERTAREAAEAAGHDEVRIGEIYDQLQACGVVNDAAAAAAVEFAAERAACRPVPAVQAALAARAPGQRLVFVSDTMLPGDWLARLLEECGYGSDCEVFTSADLRRSKHTGRLFPAVIAALGCAPAEIVHLGDNPVSDIAHARAAGLSAVHLPWRPPVPETEAVAAQPEVVRLAHSQRRSRAIQDGEDSADKPLARYVALLLIGFALFVLAEARRRGISRIYFLARDGYLPLLLAQRILARTGEAIELHYLHVSRQSVVVPSMAGDAGQLACDMADSMQGQPLDSALAFLGIDAATTAALLREIGLDPTTALRGREPVQRLFAAQPALIAEQLQAMRAAALAYLDQSGFSAPGPRLVVDVGWRGTIQTALARLTDTPAADIAGCYLGLWPQALRPGLDPRNAAGYLFGFGHPKPLMDVVREGYILLEMFLSAPHGTVLGYTPDGTAPVHATEAEPGASARRQMFAGLEADILAEFDMLDAILDGAWPDSIAPEAALFDLAGLLTSPSAREVAAINAIPFIHGLNGQHTSVAVNKVPPHEFVLRPRAVIRRLGDAPWRAGAVRASLPWPLPSMSYATFRHRFERLLRLVGRAPP